MKTTTIIAIAIVANLTTGCTQWKKLTNSETKENHVEQIQGIWQGNIAVDGLNPNIHFNLQQADRTLSGYLSIDYTGVLMTQLTYGHIYGHDFTMTFSPTPKCGSNFVANGEVKDGQMLVTFQGCTDSDVNQTLILTK